MTKFITIGADGKVYSDMEVVEDGTNIATEGLIVAFDFDKTFYTGGNLDKLEEIIDTDVILKLLIIQAQNGNKKAIDYLRREKVESEKYEDVLERIRNKQLTDKEIALAKKVGAEFGQRADPNHRISTLLEYGASATNVRDTYAAISARSEEFYSSIKPNPVVIETMRKLKKLGIPFFISTDNSKENVDAGMKILGLTEEFGDVRVISMFKCPIMIPDQFKNQAQLHINGLPRDQSQSLERDCVISTKRCHYSALFVKLMLGGKFPGLIYDDSPGIQKVMLSQGVFVVLVKDNKMTLTCPAEEHSKIIAFENVEHEYLVAEQPNVLSIKNILDSAAKSLTYESQEGQWVAHVFASKAKLSTEKSIVE